MLCCMFCCLSFVCTWASNLKNDNCLILMCCGTSHIVIYQDLMLFWDVANVCFYMMLIVMMAYEWCCWWNCMYPNELYKLFKWSLQETMLIPKGRRPVYCSKSQCVLSMTKCMYEHFRCTVLYLFCVYLQM